MAQVGQLTATRYDPTCPQLPSRAGDEVSSQHECARYVGKRDRSAGTAQGGFSPYGRGSFGDDLVLLGLTHAVMVRSPMSTLASCRLTHGRHPQRPACSRVLTGADYLADGLLPIPHSAGLMGPPDATSGAPTFESQYQMKSILLMRANNPPNIVAAKVSMLTSVAMGFVSAIWASPLWSWPAAFQRMSSRFAADPRWSE